MKPTDEVIEESVAPVRLCLACDYDLAGLEENGRCPECGSEFGDELVYIGFRGPVGGIMQFSGVAFMTLVTVAGVYAPVGGPLSPFTVISLVATIILLLRALRLLNSRSVRGGDMKWVVDERGIVMIDADRRVKTESSRLLPWRSIRSVRCMSGLGFRSRRWRGLVVRRRRLSIDFVYRRDAPIWFPSQSRAEIRRRMELVDSRRPRENGRADRSGAGAERSVTERVPDH